jgi:hypothetical protein
MLNELDPTLALATVSNLTNVTLGGSTWTAAEVSPPRQDLGALKQHPHPPHAAKPPRVTSGAATSNNATMLQRLWSASSGGCASSIDRAATLVVHEHYAMSARPLSRKDRADQAAAARREHLNLPPFRPSRILSSASTSPRNPPAASQEIASEACFRDRSHIHRRQGTAPQAPRPTSSAPSFQRVYSAPQERGLHLATPSHVSDPAQGQWQNGPPRDPRLDLPPALAALLDEIMKNLAAANNEGQSGSRHHSNETPQWYSYPHSEQGRVLADDALSNVEPNPQVFDGLWIRRQEHEAYIRGALEAMAVEFYSETLPAAYHEATKDAHDMIMKRAQKVVSPQVLRSATGLSMMLPSRTGASTAVSPQLMTSLSPGGGRRSESLTPGLTMLPQVSSGLPTLKQMESAKASGVKATTPRGHAARKRNVPSPTQKLPSNTDHKLKEGIAARVAALQQQIELCKKDLDEKLKQQEIAQALAIKDASIVEEQEGQDAFAFTVPFDTNIQAMPTGPGAFDTKDRMGGERIAGVVNMVRRKSINLFDKVERSIRFRQQATFALRRKLRALIEKKRSGNSILSTFRVGGDRDILSVQRRVSPPQTPSVVSPHPTGPSGNVSPDQPVALVPAAVAPTNPTDSPPQVSVGTPSLQPVTLNAPLLALLEPFELPAFFRDPLTQAEKSFAEYHDLAAAIKRSQMFIQTLTRGTLEEKRRALVDLGIQLPSEPSASPPHGGVRRAGSIFKAAGRKLSNTRFGGGRGNKNNRKGSPKKNAKDAKAVPATTASGRFLFCDAAVQTTLDEELLVYMYHRIESVHSQEVAYRDMWRSMYVALKNVVLLWEEVEVDLSCARCKSMVVDAMIISPCGTTVCGECLRYDDEDSLVQYERPDCGCTNHEGSMPNKWMRRFCKGFAARDVPGAITPVPSEATLGDLDYQLKLVGDAMGLLKSSRIGVTVRESAEKRKQTGDATSKSGGGILVASSAAARPGKKGAAAAFGKGATKGNERRKRSVVMIKSLDEASGNDEEALTSPSSKPKDHVDKTVPVINHPMAAVIQQLGANEFATSLQEHFIHMYKRKITNTVYRQFRR